MKITKTANTGLPIIPAWTVTVTDSGGYFGSDLTLEEILALIGAGSAPGSFLRTILGGVGNVQALGTLGAATLVDLANANLFWGTLAEDTVVTTTGWTNLKDCQITVLLFEDGTGGWTPTFSGVTWDGGGAVPTHDTTAGTFTRYVFTSIDGGTTIIGAKTGATSGAADGMVPYLIPTGQTFTVPINKQALKAMPITVDGTLVVDGFLLEVA
jgi:hypothetical protein